jgi:hypothetical protein
VGGKDNLAWVGPEPIIADSARKHGMTDEDMLQAHRNPIRIFELDKGFTMIIGANRTAMVFEAGVVQASTVPVIVHAMRAREKFLR